MFTGLCASAFCTLQFEGGVIFDSSGLQRFMASDGIEPKMPGTNLRPGTVSEIVDETATNLIEMSGVIKWFDVSKGFGFIVPDNGMPTCFCT